MEQKNAIVKVLHEPGFSLEDLSVRTSPTVVADPTATWKRKHDHHGQEKLLVHLPGKKKVTENKINMSKKGEIAPACWAHAKRLRQAVNKSTENGKKTKSQVAKYIRSRDDEKRAKISTGKPQIPNRIIMNNRI